MTELPERSRSHSLETASERRFKIALPAEWPVERPPADYGVDLQVEIFVPTSGGNAKPTGLSFGAQLKGTDGDRVRGLSVGIRWKTVSYWKLLPTPVLIVRWLADEEVVLGTWAHEHYRHFVGDERRQAWFKLDRDADELTAARVERLEAEVRAFTDIRTRAFTWPLLVSVIDALPAPLAVSDLLAQCRELQRGLGRVVDFRFAPEGPGPTLTFGSGRIEFALGAGLGAALDTAGQTALMIGHESGAADVLIMIASVIAAAGVDDVASDLLSRALPTTVNLWSRHALTLGLAALRCGRRDLVIDVVRKIAIVSPWEALHLAIALVPRQPEVLGTTELEATRSALWAGVEEAQPAGHAWMTFGLWLGVVGRPGEAREAYATALEREPELADDYRYWYELGMVSADDGDRDEGLRCYERALGLDASDTMCRALCADLLLKRGDFTAAREMFDAVASAGGPPFARLGSIVAGFVEGHAELIRVLRDEADGSTTATDATDGDSFEREGVRRAADLIDASPLDPLGWHVLALSLPREPSTTYVHVVAAWLMRFDADLWVRAVMSALAQFGSGDFALDIVRVADPHIGDLLEAGASDLAHQYIADVLEENDPDREGEMQVTFGKQLSELRNLIDQVRRERNTVGE